MPDSKQTLINLTVILLSEHCDPSFIDEDENEL